MNLKAGLLGGGSWGTTVASLIARNAPVKIWARCEETVNEINEHHTNSRYLPGATLNSKLVATHCIEEAVSGCDVLVMGVPSQHFRDVLEQAREHIRPWVPVISLTKGLEAGTELRMTEIIEEVLPGHPVGVLTGPNLAREIISGQAARDEGGTCIVAGALPIAHANGDGDDVFQHAAQFAADQVRVGVHPE